MKNKKNSLTIGIICSIVTFLFVSCGRDMSTPATRLIGQWQNEEGTNFYYGKLNDQGVGSYIFVRNGLTTRLRYRITSQEEDGELVNVQVVQADGSDSNSYPSEFKISKDGKSLAKRSLVKGINKIFTGNRIYLSSKTEP